MKIHQSSIRSLACITFLISVLTSGGVVGSPLKPTDPILVPGSHGGFDFLEIDPSNSRLLATHTANGTFDIFSLPDGKLLKMCEVGASQDSAITGKDGYLVACSKIPRLLSINAETLETTGETPLPGPADILTFDPANGLAYVGHDDADEVWAIDISEKRIVASIKVPEGPEGIVCDPESSRVFVNVRKTSEIIVIDTTTNTVAANWSTFPATTPHGLAFDPAMHLLFAAGANGKLVAVDSLSGKVAEKVDIAPKVDQIAYDPGLKRVYCASGNGIMSVVQASPEHLKNIGDVPTRKGARSVAVDLKSHSVWTGYQETGKSYILRLDTPPN